MIENVLPQHWIIKQSLILSVNQYNDWIDKCIYNNSILEIDAYIQQNYINIYNNAYIYMTQTSPIKPVTVRKQLFTDENQCPYCLMKQKFGFSEKKCLEHSLKPNNINQQQGQGQSVGYLTAIQMKQMLQQIQQGLQYYWTNLRTLSKGSPSNIQNQLQPVLKMSKCVQEKIHKFFYDDSPEYQQFRYSPSKGPNKCKSSATEKFSKQAIQDSYGEFVVADSQAIKEWVLYFYDMVACRKVVEPLGGMLPLEQEEIQMRIFKQSMQRKFLQIGTQLHKYQTKIQQLLNKLIFYMQKSSENVPSQTIQNDIMFLEGNPEIEPSQFDPYSGTTKAQKYNVYERKSASFQDLLAGSIVNVEPIVNREVREEEFWKLVVAQATCIETLLNIDQQ